MKIRITKDKLLDFIVYFSVISYLSINIFSVSFFSIYIPSFFYHGSSLFSILLLVFYELICNRFDMKSILGFLVLFGIISILMYLSTGGFPRYLYAFILIFFLRNFSLEKLIRVVLPTTVALIIFIILSSKLGLIRDYMEISGNRIRHYLGFKYALFPSTIMMNITGLSLYKNKEKLSFFKIILLLGSIFWIFKQTNSRLTFVSSLLLIILGIMLNFFPKILDRFRYLLFILIPSYLYAFLISLVVVNRFKMGDALLIVLNKVLGGRLYLATKSLLIHGYGLLGKNIQWVGNGLTNQGLKATGEYLYVDNMYIQLLQRYGLIFLLIFIVIMTLALYKLYISKSYFLLSISILLAYHAVIDDLIFYWHYNFFLILLALPFTSNNLFLGERFEVNLIIKEENYDKKNTKKKARIYSK